MSGTLRHVGVGDGVLANWKADSLRLSAFAIEEAEPVELPFWTQVMGHEAEDVRIRKINGERVVSQTGQLDRGRIRADVRANRTDWVFEAHPRRDRPDPSIGLYRTAEGAFLEKMAVWLDVAHPNTNRLAYGVVLRREVDQLAEALAAIDGMLPSMNLDTEDARDFMYQINRRRPSAVNQDIEINRLAKWSVLEERLGALEVPANGGEPRVRDLKACFVCQLVLDVNTAPENRSPLDGAKEQFKELVVMANEIAEEGDVP